VSEVAEAGKEISTRPFQLVTGRVWKGHGLGGATRPGRRAETRRWYMNGKIEDRSDITHVLKLEEINKRLDLSTRASRSVRLSCSNSLKEVKHKGGSL